MNKFLEWVESFRPGSGQIQRNQSVLHLVRKRRVSAQGASTHPTPVSNIAGLSDGWSPSASLRTGSAIPTNRS